MFHLNITNKALETIQASNKEIIVGRLTMTQTLDYHTGGNPILGMKPDFTQNLSKKI